MYNARKVHYCLFRSSTIYLFFVQSKFVFPSQTLQLTRDWILRTVNNRWRAYKSKLKKEHFNREQRSLEQIIQGRPRTVNEHQWRSLVSFWCQETHKVISFYLTFTRNLKESYVTFVLYNFAIFTEIVCNKLSVCKRTEEYAHNGEEKPC